MLQESVGRRRPQPQPQHNQRTWEQFCREEAREAAYAFLDSVRRFKSRHATAREVHDSTFTNEFSAAFLEESSLLMASGTAVMDSHATTNGGSSFTTSLPADIHGRIRRSSSRESDRVRENQRGENRSSNTGKSWWSSLFKWTSKSKRNSRERRPSGSSTSSSGSSRLHSMGSTRQKKRDIRVVKETALVQMLNLSECEDQDGMHWNPCKIMLVEHQENFQIEIYSPPKNSMPKMSLFCFLIEEVRSTTRLEFPDSNSCFAIKSQNHGEYVFDVKTPDLKEEWVRLIQAYSTRSFTANGHLPRPTIVNYHLATLPRAPPSQEGSPIRSHLASSSTNEAGGPPIVPLDSSPLLYSRSRTGTHSSADPQADNVNSTNVAAANSVASCVSADRHSSLSEQRKSSVLPKPVGPSDSEESVMVDVASFMRNYSLTRSPNRQLKTMSMFVDPNLHVAPHQQSQRNPYVQAHPVSNNPNLPSVSPSSPSSQTRRNSPPRFPYISPRSSPPPLPKRGPRPQSMFIKNSTAINTSTSNTAITNSITRRPLADGKATASNSTNGRSERELPLSVRKISQPILELPSLDSPTATSNDIGSTHELPSPGNLETCSQSSSSSALHQVSIAALGKPCPRRNSLSIEDEPKHLLSVQAGRGAGGRAGNERVRKMSAPALPNEVVPDKSFMRGRGYAVSPTSPRNLELALAASKAGGIFSSTPEIKELEEGEIVREKGRTVKDCDGEEEELKISAVIDEEGGIKRKEGASFIEAGAIGNLYESRKSPTTPPDMRRGSYDTSDQLSLTSPQPSSATVATTDPSSSGDVLDNKGQNQQQTTTEISLDTLEEPNDQVLSSTPAGNDSVPLSREEGATSQSSNHTNLSTHSNSSLDDRDSSTRAESAISNPIFVETTESQGYSQTTIHTSHPYEYWATNQQDITNLRTLSQYPWFHGMISRNNASQLVLTDGEGGTGQYLVRQSESREGDFVLTFNYHNRPKHLRMTVDDTGCNIQHLWFESVPGMLDYFKTNSIPLESFWLNDDVKLTTFIDRQASDAFRTTTVLNMDRLNRVPPRRSRSLHLGISHSVVNGSSQPTTPSPMTDPRGPGTSSASSSTHSLPHSRNAATGWRQIFRSQRSSSAGNVGRIQRSHSHNAGSIQATGRGATSQHSNHENAYVWRNY